MAFEFHNPQQNAIECCIPAPIGLIKVNAGDYVPTPEMEERGVTPDLFKPFAEARFALKATSPVARRRLLEAAQLEVPPDLVALTKNLPEFGGTPPALVEAESASADSAEATPAPARSDQEFIDALSVFKISVSRYVPEALGLVVGSEALQFLASRLFSWKTESRLSPEFISEGRIGSLTIEDVVREFREKFGDRPIPSTSPAAAPTMADVAPLEPPPVAPSTPTEAPPAVGDDQTVAEDAPSLEEVQKLLRRTEDEERPGTRVEEGMQTLADAMCSSNRPKRAEEP